MLATTKGLRMFRIIVLMLVLACLTGATSADDQDQAMREAVLMTLEEQPPSWVEQKHEIETLQQRKERLKLVRDAILSQTGHLPKIAALIELAYQETRFSRYSFFACTPYDDRYSGHCDRIMHGSNKGKIRARSHWQLWERTCPDLWSTIPGSEAAVSAAASCALRHWNMGLRVCRGDIAGAFSTYRGGAVGCFWGPAKKRAERYFQTLRQLERNYQKMLRQ